eukprot:5959512-Amphidinium_carterae.1
MFCSFQGLLFPDIVTICASVFIWHNLRALSCGGIRRAHPTSGQKWLDLPPRVLHSSQHRSHGPVTEYSRDRNHCKQFSKFPV